MRNGEDVGQILAAAERLIVSYSMLMLLGAMGLNVLRWHRRPGPLAAMRVMSFLLVVGVFVLSTWSLLGWADMAFNEGRWLGSMMSDWRFAFLAWLPITIASILSVVVYRDALRRFSGRGGKGS